MFKKIFFFICAFLIVFRFNEDYNIQPSYVFISLFPLFFVFLKQKFIFNSDLKLISIFFFFFFIIDLFYFIFFNLPITSIFFVLFWPISLLFVLAFVSLSLVDIKFVIKFVVFFLFISIFVSFFQFFMVPGERPTGISGTPNNLALSVVHIIMIYSILYKNQIPILIRFGTLLTLSRGYFIFFIGSLFSSKRNLYYFFTILICVSITFYYFNLVSFFNVDLLNLVYTRFSFDENSSDEGGRGLYRIIQYPQYLIFGSSDLILSFNGDPFVGQIHNNYLALWFSFGLFGLFFTLFIYRKIFIKNGFVLFIFYLIYSSTLYFFNNVFFLIFLSILLRNDFSSFYHHKNKIGS
jgi:hypothetical protein